MWRHFSRLPVIDPAAVVSLGEGATPLIPLSQSTREMLGIDVVCAKAEHLNPTGSFKDRIASVAVSLVVERGLPGCLGTSSGNGGAALAAYSARAGRPAVLFLSPDIPAGKLEQLRGLGASTRLIEDLERGHGAAGTRDLIERLRSLCTDTGHLLYVTAFAYCPEAMDGAKTIAFELAETMPEATVVYIPVGGGGLLTAISRGYREVSDLLPERLPRLVAVQPSGCATLPLALEGRTPELDLITSSVSGLQVPILLDSAGARAAVLESRGHSVLVADEEIWQAQRLLARKEGMLVEPAGAAAMAGLIRDAREGRLSATDRAVVLLTGAGFKDPEALRRLLPEGAPIRVRLDHLSPAALARSDMADG